MKRPISARKASLIRKGIRLHRDGHPKPPSHVFSSLTVSLAYLHESHYVNIRSLRRMSRELRAQARRIRADMERRAS